jgi:hypothetical protein
MGHNLEFQTSPEVFKVPRGLTSGANKDFLIPTGECKEDKWLHYD